MRLPFVKEIKKMNKVYLEHINEQTEKNTDEYVKECERNYNDYIKTVSEKIKSDYKLRPVVLLSGPSGSGKTTTALKIEESLDKAGIETHTISMDNYFTPIKIYEGSDLESPDRLDIELLQNHIVKMANCEEISIPLFHFKTQSISGYKKLKRKQNELIILEGIHALNPDVTGYNSDITQRIFINIEKSVVDERGIVLDSPKLRLIRRLVRDFYYRGRSFNDTVNNFESVENGSEKYVIPYKSRADFCINSFVPYEICAFKNIVLKGFQSESNNSSVSRFISEFLQNAYSINESAIPKNSILREFIGGSIYDY